MAKWFVPQHMKQLAESTVTQFGYDHTNSVVYKFNQLGFRNSYNAGPSINLFGNSIGFGVGLNEAQTFGYLLSQQLGLPCNNFSFGCYFHENHDHLANIQNLVEQNTGDIFIIQINNLDRFRNGDHVITGLDPAFARARFLDYFEQLLLLLVDQKFILMYWDDYNYNLPENIIRQISIFNKLHLDKSIQHNENTFGAQSNKAIAKTLASLYLSKFN